MWIYGSSAALARYRNVFWRERVVPVTPALSVITSCRSR